MLVRGARADAAVTSRAVLRPDAGAIVIGADYRGLGVVRSLGRAGIPVCVLRDGDDSLAAHSRYAKRALRLPDGDERRLALLQQLANEGLRGWSLFPTGDETAAFVARHHDSLQRRFILTTPSWDVLRWAYDKRLTHGLAESLGIPSPRTVSPATQNDPAAGMTFPAILKPAVKPVHNRLTLAKAWRVETADDLRARYAEACTFMDPHELLVQELIPGGGEAQFSYAALCSAGRPQAWLTARRTRQYPPDFGRASTYVESVDRPEIVEPSVRLLGELGWDGLVELEYKRDTRDGSFKLLDINPRVWGWHTLCAPAGVDFPLLAWRLSRGESVPPLTGRCGVRWVRLSTDLPTAIKEIAAKRMSLGEYVGSLRGPVEGAIYARDDVLPALLELPLLVGILARRLVRGDGV
jgi:D-aspartate ligase